MKGIPLTQGYETLVDDADFEWLSQWKWTAAVRQDTVYAYRMVGKQAILMHRLIANSPRGAHTDHKDLNGLNNQRDNIRVATCSQNLANQKLSRANISGVKGVSWDSSRSKWKAQIKVQQRNFMLGRFERLEDAAVAYANAARAHFGEFARIAVA